MLLFAMIDFGVIFGGYITMRNGVAAGARAASVNDYVVTGSPTCTGGPTTDTADMVCSIVSNMMPLAGVSMTSLSVGICFVTPGSSSTSCSSESTAGQSITQDVEVCAKGQLKSTTGFTGPFVNGKSVSASSRLLLEQPQPTGSTAYEAYNSSSTAVVYNGASVAGMNCS
jgi:Flp pilus assembly protein TadG